jgi:hypothetical protein
MMLCVHVPRVVPARRSVWREFVIGRLDASEAPRHRGAKTLESKSGQRGLFTLIECPDPRNSYIFVFFTEGVGERGRYWVIRSTDIVRKGFANSLKSGENMGKYRL